AGGGGHDAIVLSVPRAQVALDRTQDWGVVVDREDDERRARPCCESLRRAAAAWQAPAGRRGGARIAAWRSSAGQTSRSWAAPSSAPPPRRFPPRSHTPST